MITDECFNAVYDETGDICEINVETTRIRVGNIRPHVSYIIFSDILTHDIHVECGAIGKNMTVCIDANSVENFFQYFVFDMDTSEFGLRIATHRSTYKKIVLPIKFKQNTHIIQEDDNDHPRWAFSGIHAPGLNEIVISRASISSIFEMGPNISKLILSDCDIYRKIHARVTSIVMTGDCSVKSKTIQSITSFQTVEACHVTINSCMKICQSEQTEPLNRNESMVQEQPNVIGINDMGTLRCYLADITADSGILKRYFDDFITSHNTLMFPVAEKIMLIDGGTVCIDDTKIQIDEFTEKILELAEDCKKNRNDEVTLWYCYRKIALVFKTYKLHLPGVVVIKCNNSLALIAKINRQCDYYPKLLPLDHDTEYTSVIRKYVDRMDSETGESRSSQNPPQKIYPIQSSHFYMINSKKYQFRFGKWTCLQNYVLGTQPTMECPWIFYIKIFTDHPHFYLSHGEAVKFYDALCNEVDFHGIRYQITTKGIKKYLQFTSKQNISEITLDSQRRIMESIVGSLDAFPPIPKGRYGFHIHYEV